MTPIDLRERHQLCDLLLEVGPAAPTICEGWDTMDLATHLYVRERHPLRPTRGTPRALHNGFEWVVGQLRAGPPLPWRTPVLRDLANGLEYFIHHEDVRRANGLELRPRSEDLERLAWRADRLLARRLPKRLGPHSLRLESDDGGVAEYGSGPTVMLSGRPTEMLLFLSGRPAGSALVISGSAAAQDALHASQRRF
jgi:uncharacterized protein (TIGR03085 family)